MTIAEKGGIFCSRNAGRIFSFFKKGGIFYSRNTSYTHKIYFRR